MKILMIERSMIVDIDIGQCPYKVRVTEAVDSETFSRSFTIEATGNYYFSSQKTPLKIMYELIKKQLEEGDSNHD